MKLFDVNIMVHAHRAEQPDHDFYRQWLVDLLAGPRTYLYCELVLSGFVRIVTHPRIFKKPTPIRLALDFAEEIRRQPNAMGVMPGARHWKIFRRLCRQTGAVGNLIPDAYFAALAIEAQAEWMTADKGFRAFEPALNWQLLRP